MKVTSAQANIRRAHASRMLRSRRRPTGQAASLPAIFIGILVIAAVGLFAFEIARVTIAKSQLTAATEAAALAGAAAMAGATDTDINTIHTNGRTIARAVFKQNDVFGRMLTDVFEGTTGNVALGQTRLHFRYLDPKNNNAEVPAGDKRGKILEIESTYGYLPVFAGFLGMGNTPLGITATAQGGVGSLDLVLCFDCSGSMDDQTKVTRVRRRWDPGAGKIVYEVVGEGALCTSHGSIRPQQLEFAPGFNGALRGATDAGSPPGNFPPGTAPTSGITDVVVNCDEQNHFAGITVDGFDFPNLAALVEASRGNLDSAARFNSSQANTTLGGIVTPKPGYQAKYFEIARKHIHPIFEAEQAAQEFYRLMNQNTDAHFGLVGFQGQIGAPGFTFNQPNVGSSYPAGGNGAFALPAVNLNQTEAQTNFTECHTQVATMVPFGATNIGGCCERAIQQFATGARKDAKKAIILFTDGEPTVGGPLSGDPTANARQAAQLARTKGIALYTVGLALDPSMLASQRAILGDDTPGGMAKIAGNGSRFFQVTNAANLNTAFASIARHLTQLVQ